MKVELELENMSCNHCKMAVQQAIQQVQGISRHEVEIGRAVIETADWDAIKDEVASLLDEEGYPVRSATASGD